MIYSPRSTLRILEPLILIAACACFLFTALVPAWRTLNTDFPNYYLTSRMAREGTDTSRAYEWMWIEREKDHRNIDQRIVGLVPITPFSTLAVYPIAALAPLTAKRVWIALNLALLPFIAFMLSRISGLTVLRCAILMAICYPLHFNFLLGQYYVLLLASLVAACWAEQAQRSIFAGVLVGFAAALKIFPILLILYFLRKHKWKAATACIVTVAASVCISIAVLGVTMHRTYLLQVLPATLRGEGLPAFHLGSSSLSTLLHRLFLYEPQWNPHPAINAPWMFAVLHPLIQLAFLAPAVLWIRPRATSRSRLALEWTGLLLVSLTASTSPGGYLFTIMLLPVAVLLGRTLRTRSYGLTLLTLMLFLAVCFPDWHIQPRDGWGSLVCVPRLYGLVLSTSLALFLLAKWRPTWRVPHQYIWGAGLCFIALGSVVSGLRHQRGLFDDYQYRLPMRGGILLASHPEAFGEHNAVFTSLGMEGYRATSINALPAHTIDEPKNQITDQLSLAVHGNSVWIEEVQSRSTLHIASQPMLAIDNAESPVISSDGRTMAYLRQVDGHHQLFVLDLSSEDGLAHQLTSSPFNVYEASFLSGNDLIFSATRGTSTTGLYRFSPSGDIHRLNLGQARYPRTSPDGRWLAFSRFVDGNWNLFVLDLNSGESKRITDAPCNQIEPSWESDSRTLLYATDCGRSLWFTALARRKVIP